MKLLKVEDVIKTIDYIKKQTGYEGDIFLNVNVNAIPIEWIEEWYKTHVYYLKEEKPIIYAYEQMIMDWRKENE